MSFKIISHRGNITGSKPSRENNPDYILEAHRLGYEVEIDVWKLSDDWYLGHDEPEYLIEEDFLLKEDLWCHAKNLEALEGLLKLGVVCFWHENDKYTLTSNGVIWTFPGYPLCKKSICVMPRRYAEQFVDLSNCMGVCTDYPSEFKKFIRS
tara:strand:- start:1148 stop:1603 length:456 start_codon:yes stop_codon:yes gene_type:complete